MLYCCLTHQRENIRLMIVMRSFLYVAATRALHELAVFHRGRLTPLIADPAPSNRHQKEFSAEPLTKAKEYEKQQLTEKEIEEQKRVDGRRDMDEREYFGPSRIVLKPEQVTNKAENDQSRTTIYFM